MTNSTKTPKRREVEVFASFMDYVVYPIFWVLSPRIRAHSRYVKIQNAHLMGEHPTTLAGCAMCEVAAAE